MNVWHSRSCCLFFILVVGSCSTNKNKHAEPDAGDSQGDTAVVSDTASDSNIADTEEDSASDSESTATDEDAVEHQPLPACVSEIGSCPATSFAIWEVLLKASYFGDDARLVAMGNQAVLVALGDDTFRIVRLDDPFNEDYSAPPYSSWEFPIPGVQPIAVTEGRVSNISPMMLLVVTCDDAGESCSLWRSDLNQDELTPWQETGLPSGFVPRGVAFDSAVAPRKVCVYGNGMFCLDDTWQEEIALSSDLQINAAVFGALWSLAVGEQGRWFKRERGDTGEINAWQEQGRLGVVSLTQASVFDEGAVIIGEGKLQVAIGNRADLFDCSPADDLVSFIFETNGNVAYAVTGTGKVLQYALVNDDLYCDNQQLDLTGTVLDTTITPCEDSMNQRLLTDQEIVGMNVCYRLFK
jgi:hypothetical protein